MGYFPKFIREAASEEDDNEEAAAEDTDVVNHEYVNADLESSQVVRLLEGY